MIETIQIPLEFVRHVAALREAQKKGKAGQIEQLERLVDLDLAAITNTMKLIQSGQWDDEPSKEQNERPT